MIKEVLPAHQQRLVIYFGASSAFAHLPATDLIYPELDETVSRMGRCNSKIGNGSLY